MTPEKERVLFRTHLVEMWIWSRPRALERLSAIASALQAREQGTLTEERRRLASDSAHKLAGSLGMFGFPRASQAARGIELDLLGPEPHPRKTTRLLRELRTAIDGA